LRRSLPNSLSIPADSAELGLWLLGLLLLAMDAAADLVEKALALLLGLTLPQPAPLGARGTVGLSKVR
jgi:hypothetical protein